jgi:preprotein translocase subunit SecD
MLHFPTWKISVIILVSLLGILFAAPNFMTASQREHIPAWLPHNTMSLGLDLQGGSHLLLEVDFDTYLKDQLEQLQDSLRVELRKNKIFYTGLSVKDKQVHFTLRNAEDSEKVIKLIRELSHEVQVQPNNGFFEVSFQEVTLKELQNRVLDQSIEIVRRRIDETGTREPIIQRQGSNRILLQVPGLNDPVHLKRVLGKTARMTFHLVDEGASIDAALKGQVPAGSMLLQGETDPSGKPVYYVIHKKVMLNGDLLVNAQASINEASPGVNFTFNTQGARQFAEITKENVNHLFAIVLDNKVISAPVIREPIMGGSGVISGHFTVEQANDLALLLRAGALPAPLNIIEERTVGPSLGADSIASGKVAGTIGFIFVIAFMIINYGLFGVFANIALIINMIMMLGVLSLLQATLTMPGIAGIVLTMGMAVDANVLIYERIREEKETGMTPFASIERGFTHAASTIMDSNVTTLIAAFLLYAFGAGSVKGFAVTLAIGIVTSMFCAILITRLLIATWLRRTRPKLLII